MPGDSFYIVNALQTWSRELAGMNLPAEKPVGLYGYDLHAEVHRNNAPIGVNWAISDYDFEFSWAFDEKEEPNTGEFTIYNLSDDTIRKLFVGDTVIVHGGFEAGSGWFFGGVITEISAEWQGPEKVVTLYLTEGGVNANHVAHNTWYDVGSEAETDVLPPGGANLSLTYAAGVRASQILNDLVVMSGIPTVEISIEADRVFSEAVIVEGPLYTKLAEFAAMCGCTAYTANGLLVVKNLAVNRASDRLLISQHTGLLEAPTPFSEEGRKEDAPSYRGYTVKMLGNQRVQIGAPVTLESRFVNAGLTVLRGRHTFDGMNLLTEATLVE